MSLIELWVENKGRKTDEVIWLNVWALEIRSPMRQMYHATKYQEI